MRRFILAAMMSGAVLLSSAASAAERPLQAADSSITFTYSQMNVPLDGHFGKFGGKIVFDPARPETSSIEMWVDVASFSSNEDADPEAVKPVWLDAAGHPQAHFLSKRITALGGGRYQATGTLSIKGISREVTVPFQYREQGANASVDGQFTLKRGDYKVGDGEWSAFDIVANDVRVKFHLLVGPAAATGN